MTRLPLLLILAALASFVVGCEFSSSLSESRLRPLALLILPLSLSSGANILQMHLLYQQYHHPSRSAKGCPCVSSSQAAPRRRKLRQHGGVRRASTLPRSPRRQLVLCAVQPGLLPQLQPTHLQGRGGEGCPDVLLPTRQQEGPDHRVGLHPRNSWTAGMGWDTTLAGAARGQDRAVCCPGRPAWGGRAGETGRIAGVWSGEAHGGYRRWRRRRGCRIERNVQRVGNSK